MKLYIYCYIFWKADQPYSATTLGIVDCRPHVYHCNNVVAEATNTLANMRGY